MKRYVLQFSVLLAFALAFVGCSNLNKPNNPDDSSATLTLTLQDVLNAGGTVDLDNYTVSSAATYKVAKKTVIKGNAKGASFIIANGADVTFDGTKNVGTLTVGDSTAGKAVVRAANSSSVKISLKGEGVTIKNVFIYVESCTLNSDATGNSFGNVVVAETVTSLALEGKTKVSALISTGNSSITITVSVEVKIEKADSTVIEAVKKSDSAAANKIDKIPDSELEDLKNVFEETQKEPTGGNVIKSKEDLIKCVKNIIKEYYDFICEIQDDNSRSRAATQASKDEIAAQLKKVFDESIWPFYENGNFGDNFVKLFTGEGVTDDIHLESKVDLKNVGVNNGLDAFIEFMNYGNNKINGSDYRPVSRDDFDKFNNDIINIADKYASVPKLYVYGKVDANAKATGNANYASAIAKVDIKIEATNINDIILEYCRLCEKNDMPICAPTSVNLPVTEIKPFYDIDAKVAMTKTEYDNFVKVIKEIIECETPSQRKNYLSKANLSCTEFLYKMNYGISTTVKSYATVPGGIITVSINPNYDDFEKLVSLVFATGNETEQKDMYEYYATYIETYGYNPAITVTDYNGKETFKTSSIDDIISIVKDIAENIGDIIQ